MKWLWKVNKCKHRSPHAKAPSVHGAGDLSRRATFARVFRVFGVLHADFQYTTIMGNIGMVTWNSAMVRRQLSIADRGRALAWLQDGATQRNVAQSLNVSQSVIGRLWQRFQGTGRLNNRRRSGRPRLTTQWETGTSQTWHYVNAESLPDSSVTSWGLLRMPWYPTRLSETGLERTTFGHGDLTSTSSPTTQSSRTRLVYTSCSVANCAQWSLVLFSDEFRFTLQFNDGRERMYKRPGEICNVNVSVCRLVAAASWFGCFFVPWSDTSECYWW